MKHLMKVTTKGGQLHIRSGPGMNYKIVGYLNNTSQVIVNKMTKNGAWKWYKHESGKGWSCGYRADWKATYLKFIKDLDPPPPPKPPTPPPPPPTVDYDKIKDLINDKEDISKSNIDLGEFQVRAGTGHNSSEGLKPIPGGRADSNYGRTTFATTIDVHTEENLNRIRRNLNIANGSNFSNITSALFNSVDRLKVAHPDYHLTKTFSYVYITRPDLNLMVSSGDLAVQVANDPLYYYLYKNNKDIVKSLTKYFSSAHDFHLFLSNNAESFEVSDEFIKTIEHGETFTGYKLQYGTNNIESNTAGTFNIKYTDDKNYTIYKTHKAWVEYISKVFRGELVPRTDYKYKKVLDYASSVYYFVCGEDGETILFWTKYFGVFPTTVPASTSSWSKGNLLKTPEYNITYSYSFKEDFTPLTLAEFNLNAHAKGTIKYRKLYEECNLGTGKTFTGVPFVETYIKNNEYVFKLKHKH